MKITVSVTADDIAKGEPDDGCTCPVAIAARRAIPALPQLYVGLFDLFGEPPDDDIVLSDRALCSLPDEAYKFVWAFDAGKTVQPFSFDVEIPDYAAAIYGGAS